MTVEEFDLLEQDLVNSGLDNKSYLTSKGIKPNQYYYWKRKSRESKEIHSQTGAHFLPIDVCSGGFVKPSKRGKGTKQLPAYQGEIEIELRTLSGAEFRIRGMMDSVMISTIIASTGSRRDV